MNNSEKNKKNLKPMEKDSISRRTAIRKMGYAAFASSTMFLLLNNPTKVHAQSEGSPGTPGDGWDFGGKNNDDNKSNNRDYGTYDWD
ncbi:MAG: hypothetical protein EA393_00785 [Bacteroidetes bacterium]|nr:MAG: hypothetical protein EA393_00785 [Bacteroidota bacterium]